MAIMPASDEPMVKGIATCTTATCTRPRRWFFTIFIVYSYLGDVEFSPEPEGAYSSYRRRPFPALPRGWFAQRGVPEARHWLLKQYLSPARRELHPLEEVMHPVKSGLSQREYAAKVRKKQTTVVHRMQAADVASICSDIGAANLQPHWSALSELHPAPRLGLRQQMARSRRSAEA